MFRHVRRVRTPPTSTPRRRAGTWLPVIISAAAVAVILGGYAWGTAALREEVRSGSALGDVTGQVIREQFRPLGIMYGREVGVGPTLDGEYCMIVEDAPEPSVTCVPGSDIPATPASVILPTLAP